MRADFVRALKCAAIDLALSYGVSVDEAERRLAEAFPEADEPQVPRRLLGVDLDVEDTRNEDPDAGDLP